MYVFGGEGVNGKLHSIERLNLSYRRRFWLTFNLKGFTFRYRPLACPLDGSKFIVAGGTDGLSSYFIDS